MLDPHTPPVGLSLQQVSIDLYRRQLFAPLTIEVHSGAIAALMGPSGSGKSTLLAAIAGTMDKAFTLSGKVQLGTQDLTLLPPHKRGIGVLFQDDLLFPHMNLAENLAFALPYGLSADERHNRVKDALHRVEMQGLGDRKPWAISGGQRLRIALMRTLLAEPQAVLLDEPFSRLDSDLRARTRDWVFAHINASNIPALMVTHDNEDARAADPHNLRRLQPIG